MVIKVILISVVPIVVSRVFSFGPNRGFSDFEPTQDIVINYYNIAMLKLERTLYEFFDYSLQMEFRDSQFRKNTVKREPIKSSATFIFKCNY